MAATFVPTNTYSLAEMRQFYEEDGKLSTLVEMLYQDNPILQDVQWLMSNMIDGHKGKILTELPDADFRRLYQGTPYSKSGVASIKEPTRQISSRWGVDVDELKLYEGNSAQNAFRMQEGSNHIEAMKQKCMEQLVYGNPDSDADELRGLTAHYKYKDGPNVVDAGGTGSDNTSIFGIVYGPKMFHGIYPKNMKAGIQHEDLGIFDAEDAAGNKYRAVGDEWKWNIGFFLHDWRAVVRICNIDVSNLTIIDPTDANYVDLGNLTIDAKNKIPVGMRGRMRWYVSAAVMTALEKQARTNVGSPASGVGNVYLNYGEWQDSKEVLKMHGKPVLECDGILETEAAATALP